MLVLFYTPKVNFEINKNDDREHSRNDQVKETQYCKRGEIMGALQVNKGKRDPDKGGSRA